ncbi:flagellar basal body rod protein FlgB [Phenylobacterium sp.]|uniref:flagellar basal body rod protein FlgB n=1 Tax=Phenylobacterium sp. TaxID=1871053 RepID=UPI001222D16B|nr:flagellar basal body rod protein FlgB [Phenylobacterium sp.]THD58748.1 MAG: flagellar basal body rod protein FlgB [Phenylobacterium sp.]
MDITSVPILSMLKNRMGYLSDRQRIIAENVANADTPGYQARDLKPFSFKAQVQAATSPAATPAGVMAVTQPGHMQAPSARSGPAGAIVKTAKSPDSEETMDGNGVVLEDQMVKLTDTRMEYDAAVGIYQQATGFLKLAIKKPGS